MFNSPILEKSRRINHQLQETAGQHVNFSELAEVLKNLVRANTYIADSNGEILGYSQLYSVECDLLFEKAAGTLSFTEEFCKEFLMKDDQKYINFHHENESCVFADKKCTYNNRYLCIIPIIIGDERLGTLFLARFDRPFDADDLVLLEIQSIIIGMELLGLAAATKKEESRRKNKARLALDALSYSEYQAVEKILGELGGERGVLVAGKIADQLGITRSVIVNAISKLESAGVIASSSLGMKGTHIKVLNPYLWDCLDQKA